MKRINSSILLILLFAGIFIAGPIAFVFAQTNPQSQSVDITATVPGCGDDLIEGIEQCDGADLGGATCISQGFTGGTLSCDASCNFDTSLCTSGGGGGVFHNECNTQKQCISVAGSGANQCQSDNDCKICDPHGDINKDGSIDITDFSILMYYWQDTPPSNPCADINKDGTVDLVDFSIMLYWWTG